MKVNPQIGDRIRQVRSSFYRRGVNAAFDKGRLECRSGENGLADDAVMPARQFAPGTERRSKSVIVERSVVAGLGIVLARPNQFNRGLATLVAKRFSDQGRFDQVV